MRGSLRLGVVALVVAGLLAAAGPAIGQSQQIVSAGSPFGGSFFVGGSGRVTSTDFAVNVSGVLIVSFHGDPGTGCAARGLCDYSGLVSVQLGNGDLSVTNRAHGKGLTNQATLSLGSPIGSFTVADVDRSSGGRVLGHCADVEQQDFLPGTNSRNGAIAVSPLPGGDEALLTRCAGPLRRDLARAVPTVTVPVKRLTEGGERLDLSGNRAFAGGGFAGTVHSTIVIEVGGRNGGSSSGEGVPPGHKSVRIRTVNEALHVVSASGRFGATIRGTSDPFECRLLDACGLTGTFTAPIAPLHFQANLSAFGPAKRPYRDFLAALGLGSRGNPRGLSVYGNISWSGGSFTETTDQGGRCTDTAPIGGSNVSLDLDKGGLAADYEIDGSLRTRCPGPLLSIGAENLATGRIGASALRQRTFAVSLGGSLAFGDAGYSALSHSHLSLVLRRGRVVQHVVTEPG